MHLSAFTSVPKSFVLAPVPPRDSFLSIYFSNVMFSQIYFYVGRVKTSGTHLNPEYTLSYFFLCILFFMMWYLAKKCSRLQTCLLFVLWSLCSCWPLQQEALEGQRLQEEEDVASPVLVIISLVTSSFSRFFFFSILFLAIFLNDTSTILSALCFQLCKA